MMMLRKNFKKNIGQDLETNSLRVGLVPSAKAKIKNPNLNQDQKDQKTKNQKLRVVVEELFHHHLLINLVPIKLVLFQKKMKKKKRKTHLKLENTQERKNHQKGNHLISKDLQVKKELTLMILQMILHT